MCIVYVYIICEYLLFSHALVETSNIVDKAGKFFKSSFYDYLRRRPITSISLMTHTNVIMAVIRQQLQ